MPDACYRSSAKQELVVSGWRLCTRSMCWTAAIRVSRETSCAQRGLRNVTYATWLTLVIWQLFERLRINLPEFIDGNFTATALWQFEPSVGGHEFPGLNAFHQ